MQIFTLLFVACFFAWWGNVAVFSFDLTQDVNPEDIPIENIDETLDTVEDAVSTVWEYTNKHRRVIKGAFGCLVFLYGANFPATLLMYQAASASGLPGISQHLKDLLETYKTTRGTFKKEMPQIIEAKKKLKYTKDLQSRLLSQFRATELDYKSGKIDKAQLKAEKARLKRSLADVKKQLKEFSGISSSFQRIYTALDPTHVRSILKSLYVSIVSVFAAASNQLLARITIGLQLGRALTERLSSIISDYTTRWQVAHPNSTIFNSTGDVQQLVSHFVARNRAWLLAVVAGMSTVVGVLVVHTFKKMLFVFSSSTTGVKMLLDSMQGAVDALLRSAHLPTLADNPTLVGLVQTGLIALGVYLNVSGAVPVPLALKIVLAPLYALEIILHTLFPVSFLGGLKL